MVDLIVEAKREAQLEKLIKILRNVGLPIVILVIVIAIIYNIWNNHNSSVASKIGDKMYEIFSSNLSTEEQEKILREIIQYDHSYNYIARLKLADLLVQNNRTEGAIVIYNELSSDKKVVEYIRDLAEQRLLIIENKEVSNHNMYYFSNIFFKAVKSQNDEEAIALLKNLEENFETPFTIKELAKEILAATS